MDNNKELIIKKKPSLKGDDGYKTFSVRIRESTVAQLDELSLKTNRSRNELVNILLEFAMSRCEVEDDGENK